MLKEAEKLNNGIFGKSGQVIEAAIDKLMPAYYRRMRIRKEFPELNPAALMILTLKAVHYTHSHHTVFEGFEEFPVPDTGAAIYTGNHRDDNDVYKILQASRATGGRMVRTVVKKGLIEDFTESREYLASIEALDNSAKYDSFKAWVMRGVGVISVDRECPDGGFFKRCFRIIKPGADQLLGMFIQPHRYSDCNLRYLQPGVAFIAMTYADIPVYPLVFSGPPDGLDKITALKPFTYNEKASELGRKPDVAEFTIIIADTIAAASPDKVQIDWQTRRAVELERLIAVTTTKKRPDRSKQHSIELSTSS